MNLETLKLANSLRSDIQVLENLYEKTNSDIHLFSKEIKNELLTSISDLKNKLHEKFNKL